ncbi:MAG: hypothetical protein QMC81_10805 [Thermoanaerobacterales bacterium]|nr:hypothetical protein [Bacillota bacterium]MDI6907956.1 hypothetical protein [Thermoanaerobacterales bacterium]
MLDKPRVPGLKRINIFVGNLGSGKTEVAVNTALSLVGPRTVALVDLDIVNPYFRTRLARERLERPGLQVICPPPEMVQADIPVLMPAILGVLTGGDRWGVFDVGGDDVGATVLGCYREYLLPDEHAVFFVVNPYRPYTRTVPDILRMVAAVERASRVRVSCLVNNANLGPATDARTLWEGRQVVDAAAGALGRPVAFAAARADLAPAVTEVLDVPVLPLTLYMRPPWESWEHGD